MENITTISSLLLDNQMKNKYYTSIAPSSANVGLLASKYSGELGYYNFEANTVMSLMTNKYKVSQIKYIEQLDKYMCVCKHPNVILTISHNLKVIEECTFQDGLIKSPRIATYYSEELPWFKRIEINDRLGFVVVLINGDFLIFHDVSRLGLRNPTVISKNNGYDLNWRNQKFYTPIIVDEHNVLIAGEDFQILNISYKGEVAYLKSLIPNIDVTHHIPKSKSSTSILYSNPSPSDQRISRISCITNYNRLDLDLSVSANSTGLEASIVGKFLMVEQINSNMLSTAIFLNSSTKVIVYNTPDSAHVIDVSQLDGTISISREYKSLHGADIKIFDGFVIVFIGNKEISSKLI